MNILSREKFKVLTEKNGWSLDHAKGFVDGETARTRGKPLSRLALIGIDEYSLGFRAGYFERQQCGSAQTVTSTGTGQVIGFAQAG